MLPIKKILCPTDFSEPSAMGLKSAIELSEQFSAELVVVHVVRPVSLIAPSAPHLPSIMEGLLESAKREMGELFKKVIPQNIEARYHLVEGNAPDLIAHVAQDEDVDLIVIATHGESGWHKLLFGSVTEKVIRTAHCPVLVIRPRV